jgi:adenosylmethionine-8-amino-7-oxononanoate aminotransferase
MSEWKTEDLIAADKKFVWHPFTSMRDWCAPEHEPRLQRSGIRLSMFAA